MGTPPRSEIGIDGVVTLEDEKVHVLRRMAETPELTQCPADGIDSSGVIEEGRIMIRLRLIICAARNVLFFLLGSGVVWAADNLPIIDMHMHVYSDPRWLNRPHPTFPKEIESAGNQDVLIEETLAQMDAHNIVLGLLHDTPANIERLRSKEPNRFLAFPRVGGRFGADGSDDEPTPLDFERKIKSGSWSGIGEIATVYNGLNPLDARLWPYYEMAERNDAIVFWHSGTRPRMTLTQPEFRAELGRPTHWEDIFAKLPNLRGVLFHAGFPFRDDMVAVMLTYPWIYTDTGPFGHVRTAEQFYAYYDYLIEMGFGKRIMFGSDQMGWPGGIGRSVQLIKDGPWDEKIKRDILYHNAARFLRLSEEEIARHHEQGE